MYNINDIVNKVHCADSLEFMREMEENSVDLIIADPPYGMNFQSNHRITKHKKIEGDDRFPVEIFDDFFRIAKKAVYVFCRWDNLSELPKPKSVLVWVKNNWSMGDLKHEHGRQWEAICFYPQEEHEFITRIPDVIHAKRTGNNLHPTEKPVDLIKQLIMANKGDIVFDPFLGSGTTAVAARQLNRRFIGVELSEEYCAIARRRLEQKSLF